MSVKLQIKCPHLALFVARRNSGKSYLMRHLLHVLAKGKKFRWVIVITPTRFNGEWSSIVGEEAVLDTFDPDQVSQLFDRQAELREDGVDNPGLLILERLSGCSKFPERPLHKNRISGPPLPRELLGRVPALLQAAPRDPRQCRLFVLPGQSKRPRGESSVGGAGGPGVR